MKYFECPNLGYGDIELAELKILMDDPQSSLFFTEDMMRRLLARLEAAESVCNSIYPNNIGTEIAAAIKAWRRLARK